MTARSRQADRQDGRDAPAGRAEAKRTSRTGKPGRPRAGSEPTADRDRSLPINAQIFATLRKRIINGVYMESGYLPPEHSLMAEFGVSRHTIRAALQKLVLDGLVERQRGRGKGTRIVRANPSQGPWTVGSINEMIGTFYGADYISAGKVPARDHPDVARLFGIGEEDSLFQVVILIKSAAGPQNYSIIFTRVEFGASIPEQEIGSKYFLELLEKHCGVQATRARQTASAAIPPKAARTALGLADNQPALVLERTFYTRSGDPVEHIYGYCHPDNYLQIADFYREVDEAPAP